MMRITDSINRRTARAHRRLWQAWHTAPLSTLYQSVPVDRLPGALLTSYKWYKAEHAMRYHRRMMRDSLSTLLIMPHRLCSNPT
jgi:hypothetical protein